MTSRCLVVLCWIFAPRCYARGGMPFFPVVAIDRWSCHCHTFATYFSTFLPQLHHRSRLIIKYSPHPSSLRPKQQQLIESHHYKHLGLLRRSKGPSPRRGTYRWRTRPETFNRRRSLSKSRLWTSTCPKTEYITVLADRRLKWDQSTNCKQSNNPPNQS